MKQLTLKEKIRLSEDSYRVTYQADAHDSWLAPYVGYTVKVIRNGRKTIIDVQGSFYDITGEWQHYKKMLTKLNS